MSARTRWWRAARAISRLGAVAVGLGAVAALLVGRPWWEQVRDEAVAMAEAHADHEVAHPGWSFPAQVWSAPADVDLPVARRLLHAKARGYEAACPAEAPGTYCEADGTVVPRGGRFAEGVQPPGSGGWTRPLAMEPVRLGVLVGEDGELREHLPLAEAPAHLVAAILASEDEHFREHGGVDVVGLGRAVFANVRGGGYAQGASTLTMQVTRNLTQSRERTLGRKIHEIAQAVAVDRHLGKDGVLGMYLDAPYLGQHDNLSVCGFQAAARYYWGKEAAGLTLAEAATLAAILPAPGRFAPDRYPELARERRDRLLRRMGELGWDVEEALAEPVFATPHPLTGERFPAYLQAVRAQLASDLAPEVLYGAGLDVHTAMDVVAQAETERLLTERVAFLEQTLGRRGPGPLTAAGAVVDPATGALVAAGDTALLTSTDFNRATQARRQAGSSFKPLVYALAFSPDADGAPRYRADDVVPNQQRSFAGTGGWWPRNVGGRYSETACLANGLAASHNLATASLLEALGGPEPLIDLANRLGFDTRAFPAEMGLALGQAEVTPLEMARFVGTVTGGGRRLDGSPVLVAIDADGDERLRATGPAEPVLTPEAAVLTRELMALVVNFGTGGSARGGGGHPGYEGPLVGKTGTTDDERDVWFVGATPTWAAALWVGYDEPTRIGGSASDLSSPLFGWWMRAIHTGLPPGEFEGPPVDHRWICTQTGLVPGEGCDSLTAPFLPGTRPRGACPATHEPETGEAMGEHVGLWKRIDQAREPLVP